MCVPVYVCLDVCNVLMHLIDISCYSMFVFCVVVQHFILE
jgi:hypothetical protein